MKIRIEKNVKNFIFIVVALIILGAVVFYAFNIPKFTPTPKTTTIQQQTSGVGKAVTTATIDLTARLNVKENMIAIESADPIEWSDTSLGCPKPGMVYAQVITPGYKVVLSYQGTEYNYHSGSSAQSFLCEKQETTTTQESTVPVSTTTVSAVKEFTIEGDDNGLYPSSINVSKGDNVRITFKARSQGVYYGGLDFRSSVWGDTGKVPAGGQTTINFTADETFTFSSYWPSSGVKKATGTINVIG